MSGIIIMVSGESSGIMNIGDAHPDMEGGTMLLELSVMALNMLLSSSGSVLNSVLISDSGNIVDVGDVTASVFTLSGLAGEVEPEPRLKLSRLSSMIPIFVSMLVRVFLFITSAGSLGELPVRLDVLDV